VLPWNGLNKDQKLISILKEKILPEANVGDLQAMLPARP